MKVLFLDIDGVVNCDKTTQRHRGFIGIDPYMAFLIGKITLEVNDLKIVLSSSWRNIDDGGMEEIRQQIAPIYDVTPRSGTGFRGDEIKLWLEANPDVSRYAIVDDNSDMLSEQEPNFFKTSWHEGITAEIANSIIAHLNS